MGVLRSAWGGRAVVGDVFFDAAMRAEFQPLRVLAAGRPNAAEPASGSAVHP